MSPDRFEALAQAYGAQPRRWPEAERDAAQALLASRPELRALLARADDLDAWLDADAPPAADAALRRRILDQAPRPRPLHRPLHRRIALWWAGAGLAGAGALAGAMIVLAAPLPGGGGGEGWVYDQATAFGALEQDG